MILLRCDEDNDTTLTLSATQTKSQVSGGTLSDEIVSSKSGVRKLKTDFMSDGKG